MAVYWHAACQCSLYIIFDGDEQRESPQYAGGQLAIGSIFVLLSSQYHKVTEAVSQSRTDEDVRRKVRLSGQPRQREECRRLACGGQHGAAAAGSQEVLRPNVFTRRHDLCIL